MKNMSLPKHFGPCSHDGFVNVDMVNSRVIGGFQVFAWSVNEVGKVERIEAVK